MLFLDITMYYSGNVFGFLEERNESSNSNLKSLTISNQNIGNRLNNIKV